MRRLALIAPLVLASAAVQAGEPGFWLPGLPPGGTGGMVFGVSQDGQVACGQWADSKVLCAFTWTAAGGRDDFGLEEGTPPYTMARALNSDGSTVVGYTGFPDPFNPPYIKDQRAYRRVGTGPLENLGVLAGHTRSFALSVSGDGQTVVGACEYSTFDDAYGEAFRWTPQKGMQGLGFLKPNGSHSRANGISRDGSTIVGMSQSDGLGNEKDAFTWTEAGGMKQLPQLGPPGSSADARAVNADGSVVVGRAAGTDKYNHAVRWFNGVVEDLSPDLGLHAVAYAVDDSGDVIGGSYDAGAFTVAFAWTPGTGLMDLTDYLALHGIETPADYRLSNIWAISGDGMTFGGVAYNLVTKRQEGFVATIPSPSGFIALTVPLLVRRRRS